MKTYRIDIRSIPGTPWVPAKNCNLLVNSGTAIAYADRMRGMYNLHTIRAIEIIDGVESTIYFLHTDLETARKRK